MKHEYMINRWWSGKSNGTAVMFRTTDRNAWQEKIDAIKAKENINMKWCRLVVYEDKTIWSYAETEEAYEAMKTIVGSPIQVKQGV